MEDYMSLHDAVKSRRLIEGDFIQLRELIGFSESKRKVTLTPERTGHRTNQEIHGENLPYYQFMIDNNGLLCGIGAASKQKIVFEMATPRTWYHGFYETMNHLASRLFSNLKNSIDARAMSSSDWFAFNSSDVCDDQYLVACQDLVGESLTIANGTVSLYDTGEEDNETIVASFRPVILLPNTGIICDFSSGKDGKSIETAVRLVKAD